MLNHLANPLKLGVCQHAPRITRHSEWMKAVGLPQILGTDAIKPTLTLTLQRHRYSIGVIVNLWKHRPELIRDITRSSDITKRSRHSQECKNLRRGKPRASGQRKRGSDYRRQRSIAITYKVVEHCVDVRWSIWRPRDLDYSCSWNTCEVKKTPRRQTEWKISTEKRRKGSSNALSNSKMNWVNVDNFVHQKTEITFEQMRFPFSKSISQSVSETQ